MIRQIRCETNSINCFDNSNELLVSEKDENLEQIYNSRISFYEESPKKEITLDEFEKWAVDRLKILIEIESCFSRSKTFKEIETLVRPLLNKYIPLNRNNQGMSVDDLINERRKDHYSHFILRLAFCRTEELRKKFVTIETTLFNIRYNMLRPKEQNDFLEFFIKKFSLSILDNEEKISLIDELFASSSNLIKNNLILENVGNNLNNYSNISSDRLKQYIMENESFVKAPYEKFPSIVSSRSVYLKNGIIYVPTTLKLNLFLLEFQNLLSKKLIDSILIWPRLDEEDRLSPLLNHFSTNFLNTKYFTNDFSNVSSQNNYINSDSITSSTVTRHYPLCSHYLQNMLLKNSHLRYLGRQQLSLFLKGIGLTVEEALKFWSYQFTKSSSTISIDKFNKEYRYYIRHNYGLEGGHINYRPWDCAQILSKSNPSKNEYHGCPYKHLSKNNLINELKNLNIINESDLATILNDVEKREYTVACTRVFEITHKKNSNSKSKLNNENFLHINHPNLFFEESRLFHKRINKTN